MQNSRDADELSELASWQSLVELAEGDKLTVSQATDSKEPLRAVTLCVSSENWK